MKAEGYDYVPVDAELSGRKWAVGGSGGDRYLVGPLHNVKGIGPKLVNQIIGARNRGEPMPERAKKLLAIPPQTSIACGQSATVSTSICRTHWREHRSTQPPIIEAQPTGRDQEFLFFCTLSKINPRDENEVVIVAGVV
jgi:hypothetical protein